MITAASSGVQQDSGARKGNRDLMQLLLVDCASEIGELAAGWGYAPILSHAAEAPEVLGHPRSAPLAVVQAFAPAELSRLLVQIREQDEYTYVLVLLDDWGSPAEVLTEGADAVLRHPFEQAALLAHLQAGKRVVLAQHRLKAQRDAFQQESMRDPLTGLYNRAAILELLERDLSRAGREKMGLGIVMADVDHFKSINDSFGHLSGDAVLREVARRMRSAVRAYDGVGRYGGEEFLLVFPHCDADRTWALAERIRQRVCREPIKDGTREHRVSLSLGLSVDDEGSRRPPLEHVRIADEALYLAKAGGRNRISVGVG